MLFEEADLVKEVGVVQVEGFQVRRSPQAGITRGDEAGEQGLALQPPDRPRSGGGKHGAGDGIAEFGLLLCHKQGLVAVALGIALRPRDERRAEPPALAGIEHVVEVVVAAKEAQDHQVGLVRPAVVAVVGHLLVGAKAFDAAVDHLQGMRACGGEQGADARHKGVLFSELQAHGERVAQEEDAPLIWTAPGEIGAALARLVDA